MANPFSDLWRLLPILLLLSLSVTPVGAGPLAAPLIVKPTGRVILTITGAIEHTNSERGAEFDLEMLEAIGMVELATETPFIKGRTRFRGVRMKDLLRHVGAQGTTVEATALDLYTVEIPIGDFENHGVILALEANGKRLGVRDRGPTWIMYPFTDNPSLDNEMIHNRCVWQLQSLDVR